MPHDFEALLAPIHTRRRRIPYKSFRKIAQAPAFVQAFSLVPNQNAVEIGGPPRCELMPGATQVLLRFNLAFDFNNGSIL